MRRHSITYGVILALTAAGGCAVEGRADAGTAQPASPGPQAPAAQAPGSPESGQKLWRESAAQGAAVTVPGQATLAPLVKQLKPAVVNISSTTVVKNPHRGLRRGPSGSDDEDQLLERFFGQREMPEEMKGTSLGSGFVINEDGYVLTNNHVVKDATDIKVKLSDGRELDAKIVGRDAGTDVALIKLQNPKGKLPTVALGDSDALEQGDFVVAIGSPLGFRESVTFGIISAKDRTLTGSPFDDFLQTDAAINQGNSGGPLFNMKGEVIGINTAIISPQIGSGIGFAVPINLAKQLMPQLLKGKIARGFLGVTVSELTPDLAQGFGLKEGTKGALVQSVKAKAPADKAGVRPGDVVVSVNGKQVESSSQLTRTVSAIPPGGKATLTVLRGNDKKDIAVTVAQRPDEEAIARGEDVSPEEGEGDQQGQGGAKKGEEKLGIRVSPLTPQIARELGVEGDQGVLVVAVSPDGPAAAAGIRRNDVILEVNRQPVTKVSQLVDTIGKMKPGQVALLRVLHGQQAVYVTVKLGGEPKK
jgi:serine protease Do